MLPWSLLSWLLLSLLVPVVAGGGRGRRRRIRWHCVGMLAVPWYVVAELVCWRWVGLLVVVFLTIVLEVAVIRGRDCRGHCCRGWLLVVVIRGQWICWSFVDLLVSGLLRLSWLSRRWSFAAVVLSGVVFSSRWLSR